MTDTFDLVVIGAGAAGLAAGQAARAAGLSACVLEASHRVGGRAYTEWESFGTPFDHGCQWLHSASINPFTEAAARLGIRVARGGPSRRLFDGRGFLDPAAESGYQPALERFFAALGAATERGQDVAAADLLDPADPYAPFIRSFYISFMAAEPERVSAYDTGRYNDTFENWPVEDGMGALIARAAADVPVTFGCPATRIDWWGPGVTVETPRGSVAARAAIVTVSTDVLAADAIHFHPGLPLWKREAIEGLPLGHAAKIAFRFAADPFGDVHPHFVLPADVPGGNVHVRPYRRPMATIYAGGELARALEAEGPDAMVDWGIERLRSMFGAAIVSGITRAVTTRWSGDPLIRGAYSVARPGCGDARAVLAAPLEDRIFFAGEATSVDAFATAHGAHLSGVAAVAAARAALSRAGTTRRG